MKNINSTELLKNEDVLKEIHQHLWIESEKAGYDIGLEWAAEDWMNRHAQAWLDYHMPGVKFSSIKTLTAAENPAAKTAQKSAATAKPKTTAKKRRAKSYL